MISSFQVLRIFNNIFTTETPTESADVYKNSPGSIDIHPFDAESSAGLGCVAALLAAAGGGRATGFRVATCLFPLLGVCPLL